MARLKFGPAIEDVRGSTGSYTFSRNLAGAYLAARAHPLSKTSALTTAAQATFSAATHAWRLLTTEQRAAWDTLAADPPELDYDPWAVQSFRSGYSWFVRIYIRQHTTAETLSNDPPTDAQPTPPTITAATIAPYGSPNPSSYVTFTSPQPNLIPNGEFETPYINGLAHDWSNYHPTTMTPSQETSDPYEGSSAQKGISISANDWPQITSQFFPLTTHPGYWISCASKILTNRLTYINLMSDTYVHDWLWSVLTNSQWLLRHRLYTPASNQPYLITTGNAPYDPATWLLDAFKLTAPEYLILSAAAVPSAGRKPPDYSYNLLHSAYSTTPTTISIGDSLAQHFGAYPPGWTIHFKLARQSLSGLRSLPATFSALTG